MTRTSLIIALLASTLGSAAHAEAPADSVKPTFSLGSTHMALGFARHNLSSLNARMAAAGLPTAASSTPTIGIGADIRSNRLMLGATYQSLLTRNRSAAGHRTRSSGSVSLFDAGFAVVKTRRLAVYPLVGIGAAHLSLNIKELGDLSFDDALLGPSREMGLSGTAALMHTGLLVERTFDRKKSQMVISLRAGMSKSIGNQRWDSDENRVSDGPVGLRGSYVRLALLRPIGRRRDSMMPMAATLVQALAR